MRISIIGAGGWGTAIAKLLSENGHEILLWIRELGLFQEVIRYRTNSIYLPGVQIPEAVIPTTDMSEALCNTELVILAVPSNYMRSIVHQISAYVPDNIKLLSLAKGIEEETAKRMSTLILEELNSSTNEDHLAVLSGPNHAEEVGRMIPSATVVSSRSHELMSVLQKAIMCSYFRVYSNPDIVGVEICGATKNVIALAAGMSDGLGFGDNTKATLITRGLSEMTRLGLALDANPLTFMGLAGMGDLVATCFSRHSRNRMFGERIAKGESLEQIERSTPMIAEGVRTTRALKLMSAQLDIELPITNTVYGVLYDGRSVRSCVKELMNRDPREENLLNY
jgi:glycerol-3-phosphate dehydrogenase (NAD(P)+)